MTDKYEIKQRIHQYAPKSWFDVSTVPVIKLPFNSSLGSSAITNSFGNYRMQFLRVYTPKPSTSILGLSVYINDELLTIINLPANTESISIELSEPLDIVEGDEVKVTLTSKPASFRNDDIFIGFNISTWEAFLNIVTEGISYINDEIENLKRDIFLKTARAERLDQWASDTTTLNRTYLDNDNIYRQKILTEILKPKQTRDSIYNSVKEILDEYYPPDEFNPTGYDPILLEPFWEDDPLIPVPDTGLPGRFLITIPVPLLQVGSAYDIFEDIRARVEAIKAKGIKVIYVEDLITDLKENLLYPFLEAVDEECEITIRASGSLWEEETVYEVTGVPADLDYLDAEELAVFNATAVEPLEIIGFKNHKEIHISFSSDFQNEIFPFNNIAWILGQSYLFSEHADISDEDLFIIAKLNFDQVKITLKNHPVDPDQIIIDEFGT